jgi:nitronate monooxygenase
MFDPVTLPEPIVQAPMAGGASTPALAVAVCEAGGLGFLAAGYKSADAVREEIGAVRSATNQALGVNLFVPTSAPAEPGSLSGYLRELEADAARLGVELGEARYEDDAWQDKLELLSEQRVAVVSFTFGYPSVEVIARLHEAGTAVWITITTVSEALVAQAAGADALVVQGSEAGGHRGGFSDDDDAGGTAVLGLLRLVRRAVALPLIAAGAIADGPALAAVLCAGATAGQVGTALMLAPEAGTNAAQRALLPQPVPTRLTRAFTGHLARGMVNRFLLDHTATAPSAYPEIHYATSALRAEARRRGDTDAFNLWAGEAHELAEPQAAAEIIRTMGTEARQALAEVSARLSPEND